MHFSFNICTYMGCYFGIALTGQGIKKEKGEKRDYYSGWGDEMTLLIGLAVNAGLNYAVVHWTCLLSSGPSLSSAKLNL